MWPMQDLRVINYVFCFLYPKAHENSIQSICVYLCSGHILEYFYKMNLKMISFYQVGYFLRNLTVYKNLISDSDYKITSSQFSIWNSAQNQASVIMMLDLKTDSHEMRLCSAGVPFLSELLISSELIITIRFFYLLLVSTYYLVFYLQHYYSHCYLSTCLLKTEYHFQFEGETETEHFIRQC